MNLILNKKIGVRQLSNNNYCSNCGEKLENEANFCANCGQKINYENTEEDKDWTYEEVSKNKTGFSKFWGHILIGIFSLILMIVGFVFFEEIMRSAFGYYTPAIVELTGSIFIGFLLSSGFVLVISVYAIKLNLLIYEKESINWDDILLKKINFSENIFSFLGTYFLIVLINFLVMLGTIFLVFLATENYYRDLATFITFASGIILLFINSRLILSQFIVFDKKEKAVASLKKSVKLTKGNTIKLIGWLILIIIINSIGGSFVFGVFVSFPLTVFILTRAYFNLINEKNVI